MIPKIIHYCWFGGNPLTDLAKKCINTWKNNCPDYEFKLWNEDSFDVNECPYVAEAYEAKKWAFVTDYVRLKVLYEYGGIYLDTDVEVLQSLEPYLHHPAFSGFEKEQSILTGIMAAEKGNPWIEKLLEYYNDRHFVFSDGSLDLTTNVTSITNITKAHYPLILDGSFQDLGDVVLYPFEVFCAKSSVDGSINITEATVTIHHFAGSWLPSKSIYIRQLTRVIGKDNVEQLVRFKHFLEGLFKC